MIKALITDFSKVILFTLDQEYNGSLNSLNKELILQFGDNYDTFKYFYYNFELVDSLNTLKPKLKLYIFTTDNIQDRPDISKQFNGVFEKIYKAKEIGLDKNDSNAYRYLIHDLKLNPDEILYIDDNQENINAAQKAGITAIQYKDNRQILNDIRKITKLW